MIGLLLIALLAQQDDSRTGGRDRGWRTGGRSSGGAFPCNGALFCFAPPGAQGMTAECAGTALTTAQGAAVTFSRASSAYCTAGNVTTGLSNSSMTLLTTDQPRAMKGGNGSGGTGLLVETAHTNVLLRSQAFDNAAWTKHAGGAAAAPTVIADQAVAPDGTTTADRVAFSATGALDDCSLIQSLTTVGLGAVSVYIKGVYDGGVDDGGVDDGGVQRGEFDIRVGGDSSPCVRCAYTTGSWSRCVHTGVTNLTVAILGMDAACGVPLPAEAIYLWQADGIAWSSELSPVTTTSASATMAVDVATASYTASGSTLSMSATAVLPSLVNTNRTFYKLVQDASNAASGAYGGAASATPTLRTRFRIAAANSDVTTGTFAAGTSQDLATYYDGTNRAACVAGACTKTAGALTLPTGASTVYIGTSDTSTLPGDSVIKSLCVDPTLCASYGQ